MEPMKKYIQIERLKKWTFFAALGLPACWVIGMAVLNYSGYCGEKSRYLTSEERIRSGAQGVLEHYPFIRFVHEQLPKAGDPVLKDKSDWPSDGEENGTVLRAEQLIEYRDLDEFFAMNPNCCSFTRNGLYDEIGSPSLWDKVSGFSAGHVNVKFLVRFYDDQGNVQSRLSASSFNYTNCGRSLPIY